ncbi:MAG TPA: diguanylate cyclase [Candidatus Limnocylindria bacterium]|nr:diguanylate cyclase [Candidatus Limnocylindria bacterium]
MSHVAGRGVAELPVARLSERRRPSRAHRAGARLTSGQPKWVRRLGRDPYLWYTGLLAPVAIAVSAVTFFTPDVAAVLALSALFIGLQALAGLVPARRRFLTPAGWSLLRLVIALLYVWSLVNTVGGPTHPLFSLYLPVVVAAAALGRVQGIVIGITAAVIYLVPELASLLDPETVLNPVSVLALAELTPRGIALVGVSTVLAIGTRRLVSELEAISDQFRAAALSERRRSRQIAGLEAISRLLVTAGATPELLERVADVMVQRFGYAHAAIFIAEGDGMRLGAQRGYAEDMSTFDPRTGVVGRAARTGQVQLVQDVTRDPDYVAGDDRMVSEIAAPMVLDGVLLGVLNIESTAATPLDRIDRDLVATMADKLATALALARDRQALADLAVRDGLTGLHNRRFFDEAVARLLSARDAMPPGERRSVAAILFDLDHFGTFNKLHGVQVGDQALRVFAHAMRERLRQTDLVARYGGEEFVVVMDGADRDAAVNLAEEIRRRLRERTIPAEDGAPLRLTVSAGCAALTDEEPTAEALLRTADVALSMAKRGGRDRVVAA